MGLLLNILKKISYFEIDADINDIMRAFMHGREPTITDEKVIDLVVKQDESHVLVLHLDFLSFTWELLHFDTSPV